MDKQKKDKNLSSLFSLSVLVSVIAIFSYAAVLPQSPKDEVLTQYAVFFPIGTNQKDAYQTTIAAGGIPIRAGTFDFIIIAGSNKPNFKKHISNLGAFLVISATIKGGCFIENKARFKKE